MLRRALSGRASACFIAVCSISMLQAGRVPFLAHQEGKPTACLSNRIPPPSKESQLPKAIAFHHHHLITHHMSESSPAIDRSFYNPTASAENPHFGTLGLGDAFGGSSCQETTRAFTPPPASANTMTSALALTTITTTTSSSIIRPLSTSEPPPPPSPTPSHATTQPPAPAAAADPEADGAAAPDKLGLEVKEEVAEDDCDETENLCIAVLVSSEGTVKGGREV